MSKWTELVSSRKARLLTIFLFVAQLGGCAIDLMDDQHSLMAFFCLGGVGPLPVLALVILLILSFSWIAGLFALAFPSFRPFYWFLILLIPFAFAGQQWLIRNDYISCDAP